MQYNLMHKTFFKILNLQSYEIQVAHEADIISIVREQTKIIVIFCGKQFRKKLFATSRMIVLYADAFSGDKLFMIKILQIDVYKT